jgi:ribosomal protein S21
MVDFKRKKGESFESFLRRFNRSLVKSQKLRQVRRRQFHQDTKTKREQREYRLKVIELKDKQEYLTKIGKPVEEPKRRRW